MVWMSDGRQRYIHYDSLLISRLVADSSSSIVIDWCFCPVIATEGLLLSNVRPWIIAPFLLDGTISALMTVSNLMSANSLFHCVMHEVYLDQKYTACRD